MVKIIPAILEKNPAGFLNKIKLTSPIFKWIQLDIMDGKFVPWKNFADPKIIKKYSRNNFEIHLMVARPSRQIEKWSKAGAKRIIFHVECLEDSDKVIAKIKKYKLQVGLAFNPKTSITKTKPFLNKIDLLLFLGVTPGKQGQKFQPSIIKKIKTIKKLRPKCKLAVDGGVNDKNAKNLIKAGINILNVGSYLFNSKDIKVALKKLKRPK